LWRRVKTLRDGPSEKYYRHLEHAFEGNSRTLSHPLSLSLEVNKLPPTLLSLLMG
jgi:hypothetical protein